MLGTILIVIIVLLLLGALPTWPHSLQWGALPSGGLGLILLIPPAIAHFTLHKQPVAGTVSACRHWR